MTEKDDMYKDDDEGPTDFYCYKRNSTSARFKFTSEGNVSIIAAVEYSPLADEGQRIMNISGRELLVAGAFSVAFSAVIRAADFMFDKVSNEQ